MRVALSERSSAAPTTRGDGRRDHVAYVYIEAFTAGKNPKEPSLSEDALVMHGAAVFAVIDGVTDKVGVRYQGLTPGQWAGRAIARGLCALADADETMDASASDVVARVNQEIRASYRVLGIEDAVAKDPNLRFAAQLAAVFTDGESLRLLVVGDCAIRIDGAGVLTGTNHADAIFARMRADLYGATTAAGVPHARALEVARAYVVEGLAKHHPAGSDAMDEAAWRGFRERMMAALPASFPGLEPEVVCAAADGGLRGMARNRNTVGPLAHGSIDGFDVLEQHLLHRDTSFEEVSTLELYSDGYFGAPARFGRVCHWERHIADVEREDPAKVRSVLSTKGSLPGGYTDDRSILIIRKEAPSDAAS